MVHRPAQAQRTAEPNGVGAVALAPHFEPLGVYFVLALLDGRGGRDRARRCAHTPYSRPRARVVTTLAR